MHLAKSASANKSRESPSKSSATQPITLTCLVSLRQETRRCNLRSHSVVHLVTKQTLKNGVVPTLRLIAKDSFALDADTTVDVEVSRVIQNDGKHEKGNSKGKDGKGKGENGKRENFAPGGQASAPSFGGGATAAGSASAHSFGGVLLPPRRRRLSSRRLSLLHHRLVVLSMSRTT